MEISSIKIEQTYISISHERHEGGECSVMASQRIYLPHELIGKSGRAKPNKLAKLLSEAMEGAGITTKDLAIYLGAKIAYFSPYEYKSGLSSSAKRKRRIAEEDRLFGNLEEMPMIVHYDYFGEFEGSDNSAIIATDAHFVSTLLEALDYYGYNVLMVSSTLVCYAETMKPIVRGTGRVIAIDVNKTGLSVVCYDKGEPVVIGGREYPDGSLNAAKLVAEVTRLVDLSVPKTRILITGFLSSDHDIINAFAEFPRVIYCKPLSFELKGAKRSIVFKNKLAGREAMLPGIFTAIGADPSTPNLVNFLMKKIKSTSSGGKGLVALCVVTLAIVFGVALMPIASYLLEKNEYNKNVELLESGDNAVIYEKITQRRDLTAELAELSTGRALIPGQEVSYSALVEELKIALLMDADIQNISYSNGGGVSIDFNIKNTKNFDEIKTVIEESGRMQIVETVEREEVKKGSTTLTHIQIEVLAGYELQ